MFNIIKQISIDFIIYSSYSYGLTAADFVLFNDSSLIVFEAGVTNQTQCIDIFIVNDIILESSEFFNVVLNSSDMDVNIVDGTASIVIIDDDGIKN